MEVYANKLAAAMLVKKGQNNKIINLHDNTAKSSSLHLVKSS